MAVILTLLAFLALSGARSNAENASVWMMQPQTDTPDEMTGYVEPSGTLVIGVESDIRLQFSGNALDKVVAVAFTSANASRGDVDYFPYTTDEFKLTQRTRHNAIATVRISQAYADKLLYLLIFLENQQAPVFQGLELKALDFKAADLPIWLVFIFVVILLSLSSLFSGLNLGLMSLDKTTLKVLKECGSESEKRYSKAIEPLRIHGNYLLCTLLLGNVFVNSCLSILLNQLIGTGLLAVIFSTIAIVIFGEIIPQAICSRCGLLVGAKTRYLTILFMILTGALSWPLSKILDWILGQEIGTVYDRDKLQKLLEVTQRHTDIGNEEVNIVQGALRMRKTKSEDIMTPIDKVFMMPYDAILDFNTMNDIFQAGFSRIPIYDGDRTNIVNVLNLKDIAFIDPDDCVPLKAALKAFGSQNLLSTGDVKGSAQRDSTEKLPETKSRWDVVLRVEHDLPLDQLLQNFLSMQCHMGFVYRTNTSDPNKDPVNELIGLVTLEDLFEEIIQREILDETDVPDRNGRTIKRRRLDLSEVNKPGPITVAASLQSAIYQFLSTSIVDLFSSNLVAEDLLMVLLKNKVVHQIDYVDYNTKSPTYDETSDKNFLYGTFSCDYFILILQGHVDVFVGKEGMKFDAGPFSAFGERTLRPINELLAKSVTPDIRQLARLLKTLPKYKPDYKVRATCDVQYVKIDQPTYLALRHRTTMRAARNGMKTATDIHRSATGSQSATDEVAISRETSAALLRDLAIAQNPDFEKVQVEIIATDHTDTLDSKKNVKFMGIDVMSEDRGRRSPSRSPRGTLTSPPHVRPAVTIVDTPNGDPPPLYSTAPQANSSHASSSDL